MICNHDIEQNVIGGLLVLGKPSGVALDVVDWLNPDAFTNELYKNTFVAIKSALRSGKSIDALSIADAMKSDDVFGHLATLQANTISAANIKNHVRILKEYQLGRNLENALYGCQEVLAGEGTYANKLDAVQMLISKVESNEHQRAKHIRDIAARWLDSYEEQTTKTSEYVITTGCEDLDNIMDGGLNPNDLVVIGARPKMGKTELAAFMMQHAALERKKPVFMASLEMDDIQVLVRLFSNHASVERGAFRTGMDEEQFGRVGNSLSAYMDSNLYIDDRPGLTLSQIRSEARQIKARHKELGLVVIDYLTLMNSEERFDTNALAVGAISKGCKQLAKELKAPVVLLSQLSRGVEQRSNKRPMPSDLRESGAIEQDADRIIFLYRDSVYNEDSCYGNATEIILGASRHSGTGTAYMDLTSHGFKPLSAAEMGARSARAEASKKRYSKTSTDGF